MYFFFLGGGGVVERLNVSRFRDMKSSQQRIPNKNIRPVIQHGNLGLMIYKRALTYVVLFWSLSCLWCRRL